MVLSSFSTCCFGEVILLFLLLDGSIAAVSTDLSSSNTNIFERFKQETDPRLAALNTLTFSVWLSRGAGLCLSVDGALILLPMCRNILRTIRPSVRWLSLDESQLFHRQVAYSFLLWTIVHVSAHYVKYVYHENTRASQQADLFSFYNIEKSRARPVLAIQMHYQEAGGLTGHIMLLCMLFMYTTAHVKIRQQSYETFWYTHHLFIPFLLGLYTHATGCFVRDTTRSFSPFAGKAFWNHCIGYQGWRWELWGGGLYFMERVYREIRSRRETEIVRVIRHPYGDATVTSV